MAAQVKVDPVSNIGLDVLVFYQGKDKQLYKEYVDHVITKLSSYSGRGETARVIGRRVGDDDVSANKSVLDSTINWITNCDAAVAVITEDPRAASTAGNIWFEIGYWFALKGRDTLMILVHDKVDSGKSSMVQMITDLDGVIAPRFKNAEDFDEDLHKFVTKQRSMILAKGKTLDEPNQSSKDDGEQDPYPWHRRIADTIGCGAPKWTPGALAECSFDTKDCNFRRESLLFSGELLRMGRASRERIVLAQWLRSMSVAAAELEHMSDMADGQDRPTPLVRRHKLMGAIEKAIKEIQRLARDLLQRPDHPNRETKGNWEAERIIGIIQHRINLAHNDHTIPADVANIREGTSQQFWDWATEYVKRYSTSEFWKSGSSEDSQTADGIYRWGRWAKSVADLLDFYSQRSFGECRDIIKEQLDLGKGDPKRTWRTFAKIQEKLPHNVDPDRHPEVWPND